MCFVADIETYCPLTLSEPELDIIKYTVKKKPERFMQGMEMPIILFSSKTIAPAPTKLMVPNKT